jgi:hypothetical protein
MAARLSIHHEHPNQPSPSSDEIDEWIENNSTTGYSIAYSAALAGLNSGEEVGLQYQSLVFTQVIDVSCISWPELEIRGGEVCSL